jgi:hypothetical protein
MTSPYRTPAEQEFDAAVTEARLNQIQQQLEPSKEIDMLFAVTTIAASSKYGGTRCVAICRSFSRAKDIIESNEGDIFEYSYELAVVEAVRPDGVYGTPVLELPDMGQWWWVWDGRYLPCKAPEMFSSRFGFGVG